MYNLSLIISFDFSFLSDDSNSELTLFNIYKNIESYLNLQRYINLFYTLIRMSTSHNAAMLMRRK